MGRKKIKHLGIKKRSYRYKSTLKKIIIFMGVMVSIITVSKVTKYLEGLYKGRNIESSKIEFYTNIADEAGNKKVQLNWKELLAIDMVIHNEDLTNIKKKDSLEIAQQFIESNNGNQGKKVYKVKSFNRVLKELNFTNEERNRANDYLKELKNVYLGIKNINEEESKLKFINSIKNYAIDNYNKYKILPSITVGQAILESGWGESELTKKSNNLFGIKADQRWSGRIIEVNTTENLDDKVIAKFRMYNSKKESIKDHGKFLYENVRYKENGLFDASHYTTQAQALEDAGYSTKKNDKGEKIYADILVNLIRNYNLQLLDHQVQLK